jgi:hypothetical protein
LCFRLRPSKFTFYFFTNGSSFYLLYKCVVAKLGSKAGNFLSGKRAGEGDGETEIEGRDREIDGRNRKIERRDRGERLTDRW